MPRDVAAVLSDAGLGLIGAVSPHASDKSTGEGRVGNDLGKGTGTDTACVECPTAFTARQLLLPSARRRWSGLTEGRGNSVRQPLE